MGPTRNSGRLDALLDDQRLGLTVQAVAAGAFMGGLAAIFTVRYRLPHPVVIAIAIGLICAAVVSIIGVVALKRHPDRTRVKAEVQGWMRAGTLPATVALGTALPLIAGRILRNKTRLWHTSIMLAFYVGEIALQASDDHANGTFIALFSLTGVYAFGYFGHSLYYRIRWIPVLRRLLRDGQRRFAAPPLSQA